MSNADFGASEHRRASAVFTLSGNTPTYYFYIKDHLGSTRAVVQQNGTRRQFSQYYPYGKRWEGNNFQPYLYNGKELDQMHGLEWYDYGARMYESGIGRFMTMDPLCEKYYNISPYAYCGNDPVNRTDPDGRKIVMGKGNSPEYDVQYNNAIIYLKENGCAGLIDFLEECDAIITINEIGSKEQNYTNRVLGTNEIGWKAKEGLLTDNGHRLSPAIRLFHELAHQEHKLKNPHKFLRDTKPVKNSVYQNTDEENIIKNEETFAARRCGEIPLDAISRESHGGISFETINSTSRTIINNNDDIEIWKQTWEYDDF